MRCNSEELFKLISNPKIGKDDELEYRAKRKLPDCRRISALKPVAVSGDSTPNKYRRPENRFECNRKGCVNTGLLMLAEANATATYKANFDATEFAAGIVTLYVRPDDNAEYPVTVTFKIGNEQGLTNADVYTATITEVGDDGFAPVVIDLSKAPASTTGDGWTPSQSGAFIQLSADKVVGYSSISIFDGIEDFETYFIIKMRCIDSAGDDASFNILEEQCQEVKLDENVNTGTFSVTANMVSANYGQANPMYGKGTNTEGFQIATTKKTVESYVVDGTTYGKITLPDANQAECQRIAVQVADDCEATMLTALSIPTLIDVDEGHFLVIDSTDGTTDIIFNAEHVGKDLLVSYPQLADVEESVYSTDFLNDTEGSLTWTRYQEDGSKIVRVFDNVFVTGFPMNQTREGTTFNFTFTYARDTNGNFYRDMKIVS